MISKSKIETMTLYPSRKEALASYGVGRHIEAEYEIVSDTPTETGERHIVLKKRDVTEDNKQRVKLVDLLAEKLGESKSKMFKKILYDTLIDYEPKKIDKMIKAVEGGALVKPEPRHCFRLYIGDGRKKSSMLLNIRD